MSLQRHLGHAQPIQPMLGREALVPEPAGEGAQGAGVLVERGGGQPPAAAVRHVDVARVLLQVHQVAPRGVAGQRVGTRRRAEVRGQEPLKAAQDARVHHDGAGAAARGLQMQHVGLGQVRERRAGEGRLGHVHGPENGDRELERSSIGPLQVR